MKKIFICLGLSFCLMFMGKIKTNALSVDDYANYTYDKQFIMNAYQSFMGQVGSLVTGDIFMYRNNNVDYILGFYENNYSYANVCRGITGCVPETASPQLTIFSYSNDTSQSKYNVDAVTMSLKVGSSRIVKVDMQSNGKVGYRLNSDGTIIKEYPYQPEVGWPSFIFDDNFKFYTNAKIRFLRDSRFGKEFHGLLSGTKDNFQFDFPNKPLSNGTWSKGDEPLYAVPDVSEIETEDQPEGVEACEYAQGDVFAVVKYIGCWLKNIWVSIKNFFIDLFEFLFVPKSVDQIKDTLTEKFNFVFQVKDLLENLIFPSDVVNKPDFQFSIFGKTFNLSIFNFFDQYRKTIHIILISIFYILFIFSLPDRVSKTLGGIN